MERPIRIRTFAAAALPLVLAACEPAVLQPRGDIGMAEKTILIDSLVIMLAIVVPTILATFGFAWWFRAGNSRGPHLPNWAYSGRIELVVWAIPLLVIILLGGVTWIAAHQLDPGRPLDSKTPPLEVQGVSLDWKWLFIYPGQNVASVNHLVIPAATPIHFTLTSASVMNAFFIPQLGSMIYTMNGMTSQLNLRAASPGEFRGLSSHYSGDGFSDMHFTVSAMPADRFAAWVAGARQTGSALDKAAYTSLARQSQNVPPITYRAVDPGLFGNIVNLRIPPAPGPQGPHSNVVESSRAEH